MNTVTKRLGAFVLSLTMLTLSACQGASPAPEENSGEPIALGRYIEEERSLPDGMGYLQGVAARADGSIEVFCNLDQNKALGPWKIFTSADGGKRWMEKDTPWISKLDARTAVSSAYSDADGSWYLYYSMFSQEALELLEKGETPENFEPENRFTKFDSAGNETELKHDFPRGTQSAGPQGVTVAQNGDFLVDDYGSLLQVDPETMELKHEYIGGYSVSYADLGDRLVLSNEEKLDIYDSLTGKLDRSLEITSGSKALVSSAGSFSYSSEMRQGYRAMAKGADGALYICGKSGIYRNVQDGAVLEKLVDGEMTSLGMPSVTLKEAVALADGSILTFVTEDNVATSGRARLFSYTYSPTTPAAPGKELKVYSLYDNKTVRQAVGIYQREHPDTHVIYTVGLTMDAADVNDALRTLSTELIAGDGPDVLVLDGMPLDSYIEKGVLLDLSEIIKGKTASGEWLQNPASAFVRPDGKVYALPARFSVPLLLTDSKTAASVHDLTGVADYLTELKKANGGNADGLYPDTYLFNLIDLFYPICSPSWETPDGGIDEAKVRQFLVDLKKLFDLNDLGKEDLQTSSSGGDIENALQYAFDYQKVAMGYLNSLFQLSIPDAAITERKGDGKLQVLDGQVADAFLPLTALGVNANSPAQEDALAFLACALSEELQKNDFRDGMPVNAAAFENGLKDPYRDFDDGMTYGFGDGEGGYAMLSVKWPAQEFMREMSAMLQSLTAPVFPNEVVKDMLFEETKTYFSDEKTLDEAVNGFLQKYRLYLSE